MLNNFHLRYFNVERNKTAASIKHVEVLLSNYDEIIGGESKKTLRC